MCMTSGEKHGAEKSIINLIHNNKQHVQHCCAAIEAFKIWLSMSQNTLYMQNGNGSIVTSHKCCSQTVDKFADSEF